MRIAAVILAAALLSPGLAAQTPPPLVPKEIKGEAGVIDGGTIRIKQDDILYDIKLWGIDAPEMRRWGIAPWARAKLDTAVHTKVVTCDVVAGRDKDGRPAARCGTDADPDLSQMMLLSGLAVVHRATTIGSGPYEEAFDEAEAIARRNGRGIWSGPPAGFDQ